MLTSHSFRSRSLRRTYSSSNLVLPSSGTDEYSDLDRLQTTSRSSPDTPISELSNEPPQIHLEKLRLYNESDPCRNETTPTQASVSAFFTAKQNESLMNNEDSSSSSGSRSACSSPSAEEVALACSTQNLPEGTEFRGAENSWATNDEPMAFCPSNPLQSTLFIYPSSMNAHNTRYVSLDPANGLVFSSRMLSSGKRSYNFYYSSSDKPLYSYNKTPKLLTHIVGWVSIVASWRVPISIRVQCKGSKKNKCIEDIMDILFHPALSLFICRDIELDLNDSAAERFLCTLQQIQHAVHLVRVRLETWNCTTNTIVRLLARIQNLPCIEEVRYGYEGDELDSLHFKRGRLSSTLLWSRLTIVDVAGEMGEVDCILLLEQCVQATSITLRSLVNRDYNSSIVQHKQLALSYQALSDIPPPQIRSDKNMEDNADKPVDESKRATHTVFPELRTLKLVPAQFDTVAVLKQFTFPRLERLGFDTIVLGDSDSVTDLQELLIRSQAPLRELDIYDMYLGPATVAKVLRAVFVGTVSLPLSRYDYSESSVVLNLHRAGARKVPVPNLGIHFLSVFNLASPKGRQPKVPHEAEYRSSWGCELAGIMGNLSMDERRGLVIPELYITASRYGGLRMSVGWGEIPGDCDSYVSVM